MPIKHLENGILNTMTFLSLDNMLRQVIAKAIIILVYNGKFTIQYAMVYEVNTPRYIINCNTFILNTINTGKL